MNFALKYLSQNLVVIPLKPGEKTPLIDWKEYQTRKPTEQEIKDWWTKWPDANLGVVTGSISNLVIIDLDGEAGLKSAEKLNLQSSAVALTGKGKHLWYRHPGSTVLNAASLYPGLDIRGDGGYALLAPSVHPNGMRYRWVQNFVRHANLPLFPKEILTVPSVSSDKPEIRQADWITEALAEMRDGHVHNTLISILGKFRAHNFSEGDTYELLKPHCLENGQPFGGLRDKISEIWARYEPNAEIPVPLSGSGTESDAETLESFFQTEAEVKWIIPGLIASQSLGFIVGLPETSKTWAMIDLAIEAARGGTWLGQFPTKKCRVWFIDQERFRGETKRRFKSLCHNKSITDLSNLRINSGNTTFRLDLDQSFVAFRKRIAEYRPDLVIVDSLATFHTKEENNRKDIQEVLERIKSLRNEFGCTFLLIHHENKLSFQSKEEGKEPSLAEMAGNIAIPAAAETVITVRKRTDGSSLVYHTKSTMSKQHKPFEIRVTDVAGPEKIEVKAFL